MFHPNMLKLPIVSLISRIIVFPRLFLHAQQILHQNKNFSCSFDEIMKPLCCINYNDKCIIIMQQFSGFSSHTNFPQHFWKLCFILHK